MILEPTFFYRVLPFWTHLWRPAIAGLGGIDGIVALTALLAAQTHQLVLPAGAGLLVLLVVGAVLPDQDNVVRLKELVARLIEDDAILAGGRRPVGFLRSPRS